MNAAPKPHPFPSSWYALATSRELRRGAVRPTRLAGEDVVLFRTASGAAHVTSAHCPHLGAHIGHGGTIVGETIRCPFHGFRYDGAGGCVTTGYEGDPAFRGALRAWPVTERNGFVFAFHAHDGAKPDWEIPEVPTDPWTEPRVHTIRLKAHVQDIHENGADLRHFAAVHGYTNLRDDRFLTEGPHLHTEFTFDRANPFTLGLRTITSRFDTDVYGLGYALADIRVEALGLHFRVFILTTPVDTEHTDIRLGVSMESLPLRARRGLPRYLPRPMIARVLVPFLHHKVVADTLQDQKIWEHKVYLDPPGLVRGDGPIGK
ncbi:MAG: Rieske (2Fe-2S) protein, partial [Myxococcales bacterium]|nr:Rieske (2Fe-2S) protein [Myxococcales bacterium]